MLAHSQCTKLPNNIATRKYYYCCVSLGLVYLMDHGSTDYRWTDHVIPDYHKVKKFRENDVHVFGVSLITTNLSKLSTHI